MNEIRNIMTKKVVAAGPSTPIYRAVESLIDNNITGLPIVDENNVLVGMLSEKDVLDLLDQKLDGTVSDFMTTDPITFDVNDDIIAVCQCLVDHSFRRVPILEDGKIVGIISRRDLIRYILEPIG